MTYRSELTPDEADHAMANIHPRSRRWCVASCGLRPDDDPEVYEGFACACTGCIHGDLSWDEFTAWLDRESRREPTPWFDDPNYTPPQLSLPERLAAYKAQRRANSTTGDT